MKPKGLAFLTAALMVLAGSFSAIATPAAAATADNGAIAAKHAANGQLGTAITPLRCNLVQGGCYRAYRNGSIYWSAGTGAHIVTGAIAGRWATLKWERGLMGYPATDENCSLANRGCVQKFQGGRIYWQPSIGSHAVHGAIGSKWVQMGYERSPLGYPVSDESCGGVPLACVQYFQDGTMNWPTSSGVSVNPYPSSTGAVVNKRRPNSPINQAPPDLVGAGSQLMRGEAAFQLSLLVAAASAVGVPVTSVSGFRSHDTQAGLYNSYVARYGQATADTISARPGYSEHQTGLVMDIGNPDGSCSLEACFANTPAGHFAAANAWRYGFIIRYTNGYDSITGYTYEPWHLRYIGVRTATDMHNRGYQTLEQYFGLPAAPGY